MKPVMQTMTHDNRGDCHRAAVASIFDLEITQVPHFRLFDEDTWGDVFYYFLWSLGYEFMGTAYLTAEDRPHRYADINGFHLATVPSKTFPDKTHAVIINNKGMVAHDPNPNQKWLGINVVNSGELLHWSIIERRR